MRRLGLLLACCLCIAAPRAGLGAPGITPPPGARLPLDLPVRDESGRSTTAGAALGGAPVVLAFADYGCSTLCGTALGLALAALPETGLRPGEGYRFLVLGLDPKDGPAEARAMRLTYLDDGTAAASAARFLVADAPAIAAAEEALGYRADYDAAADRYDHPVVLLVLRPDGALGAVLPALGADPAALGDALRAAAIPERADAPAASLAAGLAVVCRGLGLGSFAGGGARGQALVAAVVLGVLTSLGLLGAGAALLVRARRRRAREGGA